MNCLRIIIAILVAAMTCVIADQTVAWTRYRHHRHNFYDCYAPYQNNFHPRRHGHSGYIHDYRPRYSVINTESDGWDLIKKLQSRKALELFEEISDATPAAGGPKLGIAIAAADTGQLSKSITAMRFALQYHSGALQFFEPEDWLKIRLKRLVKKYQSRAQGIQNRDAYFMITAFYYILKDKDACLEAAYQGRKANDTSDSALNLFYMAENDEWRFH